MAQSELPDLIVSDVQMPGLDGVQLKEILATNPWLSNIPMVLYTSRRTDAKSRNQLLSSKELSYYKEATDFDQIVTTLQRTIKSLTIERRLEAARKLVNDRGQTPR